MISKETFDKDKANFKGTYRPLLKEIDNPTLLQIDELHGIAGALSGKNQNIHNNILLLLASIGTIITIIFFIYFEWDISAFIIPCVLLMFILIGIHLVSNKLNYHDKYLEYRVLAESLRLQFFLSYAGAQEKVIDILPWFIEHGVPLVKEVLGTLDFTELPQKREIRDNWIIHQKKYHEGALQKSKKKMRTQKIVTYASITVTIAAYIIALIFEYLIPASTFNLNGDIIHLGIKLAMAGMSAFTLFLGSYYGKMSLSEKIDDHERMVELYGIIEDRIRTEGETDEILSYAAREFLIENSTWYAYQSKNKPDLVV